MTTRCRPQGSGCRAATDTRAGVGDPCTYGRQETRRWGRARARAGCASTCWRGSDAREQRTAMSVPIANPAVTSAQKTLLKPGERWAYGPICFAAELKAYVTRRKQYTDWVGEVEDSLK